MRVFVAGATGVIGSRLVPLLLSAGHDVIGLARSPSAGVALEKLGVDVVHADPLDHAAMRRAVRVAAPDAVVHLLTRIPARIDPKRMARDFAQTNRLRTQGTLNLVDAAHQAGAKRVITQGLAYAYEPKRPGLATEDEPFWHHPPKQFGPVLAALLELEQLTEEAGGLILRLGHLYGPGTIYAPAGAFVRLVRAGKVPIIGRGTGTFSFTHTDDAAAAIAAALDRTVSGALNVVDDEPAQVREWLPVLARLLNAPQPFRVPEALARLAIGSWGVAFMTRLRGADNTNARLALDWRPKYPSWRQGFAVELAHGKSAS
ncbi:nucleoside-diphosphate-sugar epimerase [Kribbella antiqua]|uniref:Nucleoside-diphosphate-sugar epimerase n=1 Tax=Kribbella antiqua TaxID=2512217 RepID=A0A4R2ICW8_9ACTN|nr:NAD(P)-dependent oxidoreductase [Kribbella antiqua]TCO42421.1 nucleoside-diphosphate-sugar epimerase [Kribbella antiqua]